MPKFAFTASKYGANYVISKATLGRQAIVLHPQFGVFTFWIQAFRLAQVLNSAIGLTCSESRQIVTDVLLGPYELVLEERQPASESLQIEVAASCSP